MIFSDIIEAFKNDYRIETLKRGVPEIPFNVKQLKLIFTKTLSDLQKEMNIIESAKTLTSTSGVAVYPLVRGFMRDKAVYYGSTKLTKISFDEIVEKTPTQQTPTYYAIRTAGEIPSLVLYPTPDTSGDQITVRYYEDFTIYSYSVGVDGKIASTFNGYLNIPSMYDYALLLGMMSQIFDDRIPLYQKEKMRLKINKAGKYSLGYNMDGIPSSKSNYFNSDAINIPATLETYKTNISLAGAKNGTNKVFVLPDVPALNTESIYLNGLKQNRGTNYTISGSVITMTNAPASTDTLTASYVVGSPSTLQTVIGVDLIGAKNSVNKNYTFPSEPVESSIEVYLNGVLKTVDVDYAVYGSEQNYSQVTVIMTNAPAPSDILEANYLSV